MKFLNTLFPPDFITDILDQSKAIIFGVLDEDLKILYANSGMRLFFGIDEKNQLPELLFSNPDPEALLLKEPSEEPIFMGNWTAGNGVNSPRTITAKAWRKPEYLVIKGEFDVRELESFNLQMVSMNQEINNLQRKVMKEKITLERTLKELKETQAMLIHSEKMNAIGQLVAGIAHEINNPLSYVLSNVHSLGNGCLDINKAYHELEHLMMDREGLDATTKASEIRKEYDVDFIFDDFGDLHTATINGLMRVKKIIEDLRNFSRLDEADLKNVNLLENIESTLSIAYPEIKKRHIDLQVNIDSTITLMCYPSQLNQVFLNLIINAAQAMDEGGKLAIHGWIENDRVILTFSDTGCGIPKENIEKIFNPFFTTKPVGQGTGLGLSLAYKIITDKHHGILQVKSEAGQGSTFMISLPLTQKEKG